MSLYSWVGKQHTCRCGGRIWRDSSRRHERAEDREWPSRQTWWPVEWTGRKKSELWAEHPMRCLKQSFFVEKLFFLPSAFGISNSSRESIETLLSLPCQTPTFDFSDFSVFSTFSDLSGFSDFSGFSSFEFESLKLVTKKSKQKKRTYTHIPISFMKNQTCKFSIRD